MNIFVISVHTGWHSVSSCCNIIVVAMNQRTLNDMEIITYPHVSFHLYTQLRGFPSPGTSKLDSGEDILTLTSRLDVEQQAQNGGLGRRQRVQYVARETETVIRGQ